MASAKLLADAILAQNPTEQQKEAIFTDNLEYILRAAPGSGKTWTSCRRFIWRGAHWQYPAGGLALLSFTNAAIREFKEATVKVGQRGLLSDPNYVGTFDSFVERYILAPFGHLISGGTERPKLFPGPRPGDWSNKRLQVWVEGSGERKYRVPAWEIIPYLNDGDVQYKTSNAFGGKNLGVCGSSQVRHLMCLGYYSHSQRVFWACELLSERPHITKLLAKRFPEIIVDEAQDCNPWLLILIRFLRDKGSKITLVGDPDQCIYEFSMADATSLQKIQSEWVVAEKALSQSFRCNDEITFAVRNVGNNEAFTGCGPGQNEWQRAFVVRADSKGFFENLCKLQEIIEKAGLDMKSSAVISRGHGQLDGIRGKLNYGRLKGKTKQLAMAAYLRDTRHDYRQAYKIVEGIVREITGDDPLWDEIVDSPESERAKSVSLAIWRFVKSHNRLLSVSEVGNEWITGVREQLSVLIGELGIGVKVKLGASIKKTGLSEKQIVLPLFEAHDGVPNIRYDTIHQVKGESIDGVLVVGSPKFWNSVVKAIEEGDNTEDRRLAYVAMTRARHVLVIALPKEHYNNHIDTWIGWGFQDASQ